MARKKDKLRKRKPQSKEKRHDSYLKRTYGITLQQYNDLLARQGGRCAVCGAQKCPSGKRLAVDHDHQTNKIRGILCRRCNQAIGLMEDSPCLLRAATSYLDKVAIES